MSRFFGTASDSDTESDVSEEEVQQRPTAVPTYTFSDDEEERKRIVRSAKEKRFEELKDIIKLIKNYKKNKDLSKMLSSFEELTKAYQKALPVIAKEEKGVTPRFYIQCLVEVETFLNELWEDRDGRKNLSKNNSKSLSTLRQKMRKYVKDFEADVAKFKENPDEEEEDEEAEEKSEAESDEESEAEGPAAFRKSESETRTKPLPKVKPIAPEGDESDDSYWDSDGEDETSSSDDDSKYANLKDKFLKVAGGEDDKKKEKKDRKDKEKAQRRKDREEEEELEMEGGDGWQVQGKATQAKPKMFAKDADINTGVVLKKLFEILAARGKKGTDRREQVEMLHELYTVSEANNLGIGIAVKVKFTIISAIFDYNPKICDAMKPEHWEKLLQCIAELLDLLNSRTDIIMGEHVSEDHEKLDQAEYDAEQDPSRRFFSVRGCMLTTVERMDEEFVKILKECDAHSNEYVERLKDETRVSAIIDSLQTYIERQSLPAELCRLYMRKIEHMYYKFDPNTIKQSNGESNVEKDTTLAVMDRLCRYIYVNDKEERIRPRAMLCHIYHYALHDEWYKARDLMLMSHLQETVHLLDPSTQILYNRTMVQLGLCAFRHGHIKEAHHALLDIQSSGRAKELLAQGLLLQRQHERTSEQEKIEKQRQMPFHMHINLELLECVYLVSAMLIEIPYMAAHESDARRRMISKSFHHQLKVSERQAVTGPPESMREHVVAASKAMRNGLWKQAHNFIINEKMNAKVWDLFYQADRVRTMLVRKIQEESLRTYLFTHSSVYDSLSMATLSKMFDLEQPTVHAIISKMVMNEELMASLDEPTQSVVMHRTEPSRLQSMSLQLADKLANLVDNNERILKIRQGPFGFSRGNQNVRFGDRPQYGNRQGQQGGGGNWQRRGGDNRDNRDNHRDNRDNHRDNRDRHNN
uniref:Eukaryotic translation initiation factor 3 subunit C n=1 Tax=Daphnia magna TaxID=35525 RepID=A0A0P6G0J7_9CRUS